MAWRLTSSSPSPPLRLARVAAVALLVGAAGCGSSSSGPSRATFVKQANAICQRGNQITNAAADKAFPRNGKQPTPAQVENFVRTVDVPEIQRQTDQIRALPPPPADKDKVERMLALAQSDLDRVKANPAALASNNSRPFKSFAALAHPYGLTACAPNE
jgi:hypothetical protein